MRQTLAIIVALLAVSLCLGVGVPHAGLSAMALMTFAVLSFSGPIR